MVLLVVDLIVPGTGISAEGHPENRGESCF